MASKTDKPVGKNTITCHLCGVNNQGLAHHKRHLLTHTGEKPYKCKICQKPFSRPFTLKHHINNIHGKQKQFKCTYCVKQFASRYEMKSHERTHTGEKPFGCSLCNKSFAHYGTLRDHMLRHTGEKPFQCTVCNVRYVHKTDLKRHLKIHQAHRFKKWSCLFCGTCVLEFFSIIRHMCIHTKENPCWCHACKECFNQKAHLTKQQITKHSDERKHTCELCGKTFKERSGLQMHIRRHLNEKEFTCTVCRKNYMHELEKHVQKHKPMPK